MTIIFYLCAVIAVLATVMVITRLNAVHALLYFIMSLLAVAVLFYVIGAPFVAALEVIIYAGAIMVLFVFVVMLLNLGPQSVAQERQWLAPRIWIGPSLLAAILIALLIDAFDRGARGSTGFHAVSPQQVGIALFGPYLLGTELASMLLLAGLVGAYHLGRRERGHGTEFGQGTAKARNDTKARNELEETERSPESPVRTRSDFALSSFRVFVQRRRNPVPARNERRGGPR